MQCVRTAVLCLVASAASAAGGQRTLSLGQYLQEFLARDPTWRVVALEASIARLRTKQSGDRADLRVGLAPSAGFHEYFFGGDGHGTAVFGVPGLESTLGDRKGGTLSLSADTQLFSDPDVTPSGHTARGHGWQSWTGRPAVSRPWF